MITKKETVEKLMQMHNDNIVITKKTMQENFDTYNLSMAAIREHFKSLTLAKKELNIPITMNRTSSKEEAISKIQYLHKKYGYFSKILLEKLSIKEEPMLINSKTIVRFWGNFEKMYLEIPEINRNPCGIIKTEEELLSNLKRLNEKFGYVNCLINSEYGDYSYSPYLLRWKTFEEACKVANVNYKPFDKWIAEEYAIEHTATSLNEIPIRQKSFEWLKGKSNRRYYIDAFYPEHNLALEYNGKQHYEYCNFFHKDENLFLEAQKRDLDKYSQLKEKGINLIIHKYSDELTTLEKKLLFVKNNPKGLYHDPLFGDPHIIVSEGSSFNLSHDRI